MQSRHGCARNARAKTLSGGPYSGVGTHIDEFMSIEAAKKLKFQVKAPLVTAQMRVRALVEG